MGIEPTRAGSRRLSDGFEDRGAHQDSPPKDLLGSPIRKCRTGLVDRVLSLLVFRRVTQLLPGQPTALERGDLIIAKAGIQLHGHITRIRLARLGGRRAGAVQNEQLGHRQSVRTLDLDIPREIDSALDMSRRVLGRGLGIHNHNIRAAFDHRFELLGGDFQEIIRRFGGAGG
jgi:hypothetical protein